MVRYERDQERARIRQGREAERQRLIEAKRNEKEEQLAQWRLEFDEHQERDEETGRIANNAPEIEDRDQLYEELRERRVFQPEPFTAPPSIDNAQEMQAARNSAEQRLSRAIASFKPNLRSYRIVEVVSVVVGGSGLVLFLRATDGQPGLWVTALGLLGVVTTEILANSVASRQRSRYQTEARQNTDAELGRTLSALEQDKQILNQSRLRDARAMYDSTVLTNRADFEQDEDERLKTLADVVAGNVDAMKSTLETVFPLDLPISTTATLEVNSSTIVTIEIDLPEPSVLPQTEARLQTSGKVVFKEKSEKRLRDEYRKLVAGLAMRHAAETLLNLPTCMLVKVMAFRELVDSSLGRSSRSKILDVEFNYPTFAPMTMDEIDPIAALKHFKHRMSIDEPIRD